MATGRRLPTRFTIIDLALAEDTGHGDITSEILIHVKLQGKATLLVTTEEENE